MAKRILFTKSVLQSIPSYYLQVALLPQKTMKLLNQIVRKFISGKERVKRKFTLLAKRLSLKRI